MVKFSSKEILQLFIAAVVLGLLFGFDDQQETFQLGYWLTNLLIMILLSFFSLVLYDSGHKFIAKRKGCESTIKIWSMSRFYFRTRNYLKGPIKSIPLGVIIPLFIIFLTNGLLKIAAITTTIVSTSPSKRLGRRYSQITDAEEGQIALAGPVTSLMIALLAKSLVSSFPIAYPIMLINLHLAFFNMLPIPSLDGIKVYFGSPLMFSFYFALILISFFFLRIISPLTTLLLGIIIALGIVITHWNNKFVKS